MKIINSEFQSMTNSQIKLLRRKGVFPYDYLDNIDKLDDNTLPTRKDFYSSLDDSEINEEDYQHALNVWRKFNINNLGEYSDLYLKIDILALSDIFENFREMCSTTYKLDPAHYFTLPGFTFDAMLKYTKVNIELLTNIDQILFIEKGIRGGICHCANRYTKVNNKYIKEYDPSKRSSYLMYFDINSLYPWAMCENLPLSEFEWCNENINVLDIDNNSETGYILEVDIDYPINLHNYHNDYPFCPEHKAPLGSNIIKLLSTLENKSKYVIHFRALKQAISHGLILKKVHRILKFKQKAWLKPYIDLNIQKRIEATNDFDKGLFKLMSNAVFGKTIENVRKHVNIKLVSKWSGRFGARNLIMQPNFKSRTIFNKNLAAIEMYKTEINLNKPIVVGMAILDISKTHMYDFHYNFMKANFKKQIELNYTDTDSFIYTIFTNDIYKFIRHNPNRFDTSDYKPNNKYNIKSLNKKTPGLMKDENNGVIMTEFVGLRSKMYSTRVKHKDKIKKAKGVKSYVVKKQLKFKDYLECIKNNCNINIKQNLIMSKLHNVLSVEQKKVGLSPFDDKRFLIPNKFSTLAWGHYKI